MLIVPAPPGEYLIAAVLRSEYLSVESLGIVVGNGRESGEGLHIKIELVRRRRLGRRATDQNRDFVAEGLTELRLRHIGGTAEIVGDLPGPHPPAHRIDGIGDEFFGGKGDEGFEDREDHDEIRNGKQGEFDRRCAVARSGGSAKLGETERREGALPIRLLINYRHCLDPSDICLPH